MRSGTKSTFVSVLERYSQPTTSLPNNPLFVMDGGFLLHKVAWPDPVTFAQVCATYVAYEQSFSACDVAFDGYEAGPSTKDEAHMRRCMRVTSTDIDIRGEVFVSCGRERLLNNERNKC